MKPDQRNLDCGRLIAFGLLSLLLAPIAQPQTATLQAAHDVESIRATAATFARERLRSPGSVLLHVEAGALDARLRLPACNQRLRAFAPGGELRPAARLTIGVRCEVPAWTVYVPVIIESELAVLVITRALPRNATITAMDVESQPRRVPGLATGHLTSPEQLHGRHLRNAVAPGTALAVDLLSVDVLIRRGQRVTLVASVGGLEVRAQGEAMADAQSDGRIRVLNLNSRRVVEGRAESRDSVRISL